MTRRLTVRKFGRYRGVLPVPSVTPIEDPVVTAVTPSSGGIAGGTSITNLAGTGFQSGSTVTFNGVAATSVVFVNSTKLTCVTPASAAGAQDIVVTNPDTHTSGSSGAGLFTYLAAAPTVSAVTPNTGDDTGGTAITNLAGTGFVNGATVKIGGVSATDVVFVNSTKLTCTTPAGTAGAQNVVVTNPDTQTSGSSGNGLFTYVVSFDPASLAFTSWFRGSYVSLPWNGTASAGASNTFKEASNPGQPLVGRSKGGFDSILYDTVVSGNESRSVPQLIADSSLVAGSSVITTSAYTIMGMVWLETASAPLLHAYLDRALLIADAHWGVVFNTDGINVFHFVPGDPGPDGNFPHVAAAMSTGAWHFFCIRYDGTNVQIDVDSTAGTPTALGQISGLTQTLSTGRWSATASFDGFNMMERATLQTAISDANRNNYKAYLNARYGTTF